MGDGKEGRKEGSRKARRRGALETVKDGDKKGVDERGMREEDRHVGGGEGG